MRRLTRVALALCLGASVAWSAALVAGSALRVTTLQPSWGGDIAAVLQWITGVAHDGTPWLSALPLDRPGWWDRSHFTPGLLVFVPLAWLHLPLWVWPCLFTAVYLSAALPMASIATRVSGSRVLGAATALVWLWNPFTARIALSGLHEGPVIAALAVWALGAASRGRILWMAGLLSIALSLREDSFVRILAVVPLAFVLVPGRWMRRAAATLAIVVLAAGWLAVVDLARPRVSEFVSAQWFGIDAGGTEVHDVLVPNARRFEGNPEGWRADARERVGVGRRLFWPALGPGVLAPEAALPAAVLTWAATCASPNGIKSTQELASDRNIYHLATLLALGTLSAALGWARVLRVFRRVVPRGWRAVPWDLAVAAGWLVFAGRGPQGPWGADPWGPFEAGADALACWRRAPAAPVTPTPWGIADRLWRAPAASCGAELRSARALVAAVPRGASVAAPNAWLPLLADRPEAYALEFAEAWEPRWTRSVQYSIVPDFLDVAVLPGQWAAVRQGTAARLWRRVGPGSQAP